MWGPQQVRVETTEMTTDQPDVKDFEWGEFIQFTAATPQDLDQAAYSLNTPPRRCLRARY